MDTGVGLKRATKLIPVVTLRSVLGLSVELSLHSSKSYPEAGIAMTAVPFHHDAIICQSSPIIIPPVVALYVTR